MTVAMSARARGMIEQAWVVAAVIAGVAMRPPVLPAMTVMLPVPVPVVVHGLRISRSVLCGQTSNPPGLHFAALMKLSVVIPVCNEADNVGPLAREIQAALGNHQLFEIIFVDDG